MKITVPMVPPGINQRLKMHHMDYKRVRDGWQSAIYHLVSGLNRANLYTAHTRHEKMRVKIHIEHSRLFDPDNLTSAAKTPLDCLRRLKFLFDDTPQYLELDVTQSKSRENQTTIEITEAENGS